MFVKNLITSPERESLNNIYQSAKCSIPNKPKYVFKFQTNFKDFACVDIEKDTRSKKSFYGASVTLNKSTTILLTRSKEEIIEFLKNEKEVFVWDAKMEADENLGLNLIDKQISAPWAAKIGLKAIAKENIIDYQPVEHNWDKIDKLKIGYLCMDVLIPGCSFTTKQFELIENAEPIKPIFGAEVERLWKIEQEELNNHGLTSSVNEWKFVFNYLVDTKYQTMCVKKKVPAKLEKLINKGPYDGMTIWHYNSLWKEMTWEECYQESKRTNDLTPLIFKMGQLWGSKIHLMQQPEITIGKRLSAIVELPHPKCKFTWPENVFVCTFVLNEQFCFRAKWLDVNIAKCRKDNFLTITKTDFEQLYDDEF